MAITATRDKLRLKIGDTDTDNPLFQDDELDLFLTQEANDLANAALAACEAAAFKLARAYDFETDGQAFKRSQQSAAFLKVAGMLRSQGAVTATDADTSAGLAATTVDITRVDGFSDDLLNQDTAGVSQTNPRRRYYGDPDRVP